MKKKALIIALVVIVVVAVALFASSNNGIKLEKVASDAPSRITKQYEQETKWVDELENGDYTIENPMILQDPYETNSLAAYIAFNYDEPVSYEYTVDGKIPFSYSNDNLSKQVVLPVVALYNDTDNNVNVKLTNKAGEEVENTDFTISTKGNEVERDSTKAEVKIKADFDEYMDGKWIVDNFINVYDQNGVLRADNVDKHSNYAGMKFYDNQFLVMDRNEADDKEINTIFSYTLMGRVNPTVYFEAPEGTKFHHDLTVADGKLIALTSAYDESSELYTGLEENLISIYDYSSGDYIETIDTQDIFMGENPDQMNQGSSEIDIHNNSLDYYEEGNLVIFNSRSYSGFVALDLDTLEPVWMVKDPKSVGKDNQDLLLEEKGDMVYPSGEHTAYVVEDMPGGKDGMLYISVFDNRQCVSEDGTEYIYYPGEERDYSLCTATPPESSRGIVYEIDPVNLTISTFQVLDFANYSAYKGGFDIYPDGYKTTYVADMNKFEIYNPENELVAVYTLGGIETAVDETTPFLYRAVAYDTESVQNFVEVNESSK